MQIDTFKHRKHIAKLVESFYSGKIKYDEFIFKSDINSENHDSDIENILDLIEHQPSNIPKKSLEKYKNEIQQILEKLKK